MLLLTIVAVKAAAQETVDAILALGRKAIKIKANVANAEEVAAMVEETHKTFGHIDILVNNAGITRDGLLMRMKDEDFDAVIDINLKGVYLVTKSSIQNHDETTSLVILLT